MSDNQDFCTILVEEMGFDESIAACEASTPVPVDEGSPVDELDVIDRGTDTLVCGRKDNEYVLGLEGQTDIPILGLGELGRVRGNVSVNLTGFECKRFPK